MRNLTLLTTLALLLLTWSCSKETSEPETIPSLAQEAIQKAEARAAEALKELQEDELTARSGNTVVLEAGSVDGLANALAAAGYNGTVLVASGDHYESGRVEITQRVRIQGEPGAVLHVTAPGVGFTLDPALYIRNASRVQISGLEIRAQNGYGHTAILVENGNQVRIHNNNFFDFHVAIWTYGADHGSISNNYLRGRNSGEDFGMILQRGVGLIVFSNEVTNYYTGIFMSDRNGIALQNETYGNSIGMFMCTAANSFLPDGTPMTAPDACNHWIFFSNNSHDNFLGYLGMDNAHHNILVRNNAANNAGYDIYLRGEVQDGDITYPTSYDNTVISLGALSNLIIKGCGENNTIIGGTQVDTSIDPCP